MLIVELPTLPPIAMPPSLADTDGGWLVGAALAGAEVDAAAATGDFMAAGGGGAAVAATRAGSATGLGTK